MDAKKETKLKRLGGRVTSVPEFLGLSAEDIAVIEALLTLANSVKARRTKPMTT